MIHEVKCAPIMFERLLSGEKTFDLRRDDRGYQMGDELRLREYDDKRGHECDDPTCRLSRYTGRVLVRRIGFVAKGVFYGLDLGAHAILSLRDDGSPTP